MLAESTDQNVIFISKYYEIDRKKRNLTVEAAVVVAGVVGEFELAPVDPDARLP